MKICVYAFSTTAHFFARLMDGAQIEGSNIEWSVILPRWHYRSLLSKILPENKILYLYQNFFDYYKSIDDEYEFHIASEFDSEFLCLLKDKGGYSLLEGREQIRRAATIAKIYREFLEKTRPEYILMPDVEVVDGFILLSLCKTLGIKPIYYVGMRFMEGGFFSDDCNESLPKYFGEFNDSNIAEARDFLNHFLASDNATFKIENFDLGPVVPVKSIWIRAPEAILNHLRYERYYAGEDSWPERLKRNLVGLVDRYRSWFFKHIQIKWFDLSDDVQALPNKFILYALQYTPESSINGLEPYYVDQLRAIDLLLSAMPSNYRLVVKEHRSMAGIRPQAFYKQLRLKPGVILAAPSLNTRRLIMKSRLVASITGTIGLESYLLGKPSILFGRNFFKHLCGSVDGARSIKNTITKLIDNFNPPSFDERVRELARLINIRYSIILTDPIAFPEVLGNKNVYKFKKALIDHIARVAEIDLIN